MRHDPDLGWVIEDSDMTDSLADRLESEAATWILGTDNIKLVADVVAALRKQDNHDISITLLDDERKGLKLSLKQANQRIAELEAERSEDKELIKELRGSIRGLTDRYSQLKSTIDHERSR